MDPHSDSTTYSGTTHEVALALGRHNTYFSCFLPLPDVHAPHDAVCIQADRKANPTIHAGLDSEGVCLGRAADDGRHSISELNCCNKRAWT